jgi:outer membrane protein assembly factor BamA
MSSCSAFSVTAQNKYLLVIQLVDKDTSYDTNKVSKKLEQLHLVSSFATKALCLDYINKLPDLLLNKGFPAASVDSVDIDSVSTYIELYLGEKYKWVQINTDRIESKVLKESGWSEQQFKNKIIDFPRLNNQQQRLLNYYERSGYPFAEIKLDSVEIEKDKIKGKLIITKGVVYHIDSIRVYGKVKIKNIFLQHYLNIEKGDVYNKDKLQNISKRLLELPYIQEQHPWNLSMLGTGATLNLYLVPKRSSQVNFLVGFLPANTQTGKTQLTGEVNLDLKNALGSGESILLNWQQLQRKSPRLNVGYQEPYIFNSPFGIDLTFDLLKRDSTYLQLNSQIGFQYILSANQSGKIFFQNQRAYLLQGGFDTNQVKITRKLPQDVDINSGSVGIDYQWVNTNYRLNPQRGNEIKIITTAGLKKITKNNDIINLKDAANPTFNFSSLYDSLKLKTYQLRLNVIAAHYFPSGKKSTVKAAVNAGVFGSQHIFRNELYRIGGYKLLRGFNEESIYATRYGIFTAEYRYLVGINSYLFAFTDVGFTKTQFQSTLFTGRFTGAGLGLTFETKFGLLNVSYAIGKKNDLKLNIREASKIHFGYINYF